MTALLIKKKKKSSAHNYTPVSDTQKFKEKLTERAYTIAVENTAVTLC